MSTPEYDEMEKAVVSAEWALQKAYEWGWADGKARGEDTGFKRGRSRMGKWGWSIPFAVMGGVILGIVAFGYSLNFTTGRFILIQDEPAILKALEEGAGA